MIRMHQFRSAQQLKNYYTAALAGGDYYMQEEQHAAWGGLLAKRLGLEPTFSARDFAALTDNLHPGSKEPLTPRTNDDRTVAYDINFHVPKSVSILHTVTQDRAILDAIRASVQETMLELERQARTRVRIDGQESERETGELVWAEFLHPTTRPVDGVPDPHLHVHCLAFNATWDPVEERIKATQFRDIKRDMPYYEAAFYSRLAWRLTEMGYRIDRDGKKWEVAGISKPLRDKFSRRTLAIEATAKELGITDPERKAELGAKTRSKKEPRFTPEELRTEWLGRMTPEERASVDRVAQTTQPQYLHDERDAARQSLEFAIGHKFDRESVVAEPRLKEDALRHGLGQFRPEALRDAAAEHAELLRQKEGTQTVVTTRQVLEQERAMLAFAQEGRGACPALERDRPWEPGLTHLNKQQASAVEHLLRSRDRVMLLRGGAGTGKTTLMREAAKAIEGRGTTLTVLAPTSDASRGVLRQAGFEQADTIKTFLDDPKRVEAAKGGGKGGVIWVDEAGLVDVATMAKLFAAAEKIDARVVLCGDTKQHTPVGRGDALRLLETRLDLVPAELSEIVRQQGTYKEAVAAIAKGEFARGIEALDQLGAIRELEGKDWVPLVLDYLETVKRGRSALVVAPTHAEGATITSLIRASLQREGKVSQDERLLPQLVDLRWTAAERTDATKYAPGQIVQFHRAVGKRSAAFKAGERLTVTKKDDDGRVWVKGRDDRERVLPLQQSEAFGVHEERLVRIAAGETIRLTGNGRTADGKHRLNNGAVHQVAGFTPEGNLQLSNGWVMAREYGRLDHGYVSTSHASQGRTVDWVFIAQSRAAGLAASAEQVYVSVSRGRSGVRVYTDDRKAILEALARSTHRQSAVEMPGDVSGAERSRQHAVHLARLQQYEHRRSEGVTRTQEREYGYER